MGKIKLPAFVILGLCFLLNAFSVECNSQERKVQINFCQFEIPDSLKSAYASFNVIYFFSVNDESKPIKITKSINKYVTEEQVVSCIQDWRLRGFKKDAPILAVFRWQHDVGWVSLNIAGDGYFQSIKPPENSCPYCRLDGSEKYKVSSGQASNSETVYLTPEELNKRIIYLAPLSVPPSLNVKIRGKQIVTVDVSIGKDGRVIKAVASRGHPALKGNAETAARYSKFVPLKVEDEYKNIRGKLIYEWSPARTQLQLKQK